MRCWDKRLLEFGQLDLDAISNDLLFARLRCCTLSFARQLARLANAQRIRVAATSLITEIDKAFASSKEQRSSVESQRIETLLEAVADDKRKAFEDRRKASEDREKELLGLSEKMFDELSQESTERLNQIVNSALSNSAKLKGLLASFGPV